MEKLYIIHRETIPVATLVQMDKINELIDHVEAHDKRIEELEKENKQLFEAVVFLRCMVDPKKPVISNFFKARNNLDKLLSEKDENTI